MYVGSSVARSTTESVACSTSSARAVAVNAFVFEAIPGDPVNLMLAGVPASEEVIANERARLGLDRPLWEQYWIFVSNAVHGDFGRSFVYNIPVLELIGSRLPATLELVLISVISATVLGVALGAQGLEQQQRGGRIPGFHQLEDGLEVALVEALAHAAAPVAMYFHPGGAWLATGLDALWMAVAALLLCWQAPRLLCWFSDTAAVVEVGTSFLRTVAPFFVFAAPAIVLGRGMQGAGNTVPPMVITLVSLWVLQVPLAVALSRAWEPATQGVWWAMAAASSNRSISK